MKIKLMPMLAGTLMVALAFSPVAAEACSERKNKTNSGTTSQPSTVPTSSGT